MYLFSKRIWINIITASIICKQSFIPHFVLIYLEAKLSNTNALRSRTGCRKKTSVTGDSTLIKSKTQTHIRRKSIYSF